MKWLLLIFLSLFLIHCQSKQQVETNANQTIKEPSKIEQFLFPEEAKFPFETKASTLPYDSTLSLLLAKKQSHRIALSQSQITIDSVCQFFCNAIVEDIIPYWYGTTWDFNGHTNLPNDGTIACGYFVSTTLRHLDLKVNRFKLAQQASLNIVKSLACSTKIYSYSNPDKDKMVEELKSTLAEGLYVVGLSNHVGFLYLKENELYFLHSTFLSPGEVIAEIAANSDAFMWSNVYYISSVSNNYDLMKKWLNDEQLTIIGS